MIQEIYLPANFKCNHRNGCDPICRREHPLILNCNKKVYLTRISSGKKVVLMCTICGEVVDVLIRGADD